MSCLRSNVFGGFDRILAGVFGTEQGVICGRQQICHVIGVIRKSGDPGAGTNADRKALVTQKNMVPYPSLNFICLLHGLGMIKVGQDNHELIAGIGYGIGRFFEGLSYGCGHLFNGAAAVEMAIRVHYGFETVEIHENEGNNQSVGLCVFDQVGQGLIQIAAVVKAGQIVAHGLLAKTLLAGAQRLFGLFAFGDVDHGDENAAEGVFMAGKRQGFTQNALLGSL